MAPETASAQTKSVTTTVALRGENKPKLTNNAANQLTSTTITGSGMELGSGWLSRQRILAKSTLVCRA